MRDIALILAIGILGIACVVGLYVFATSKSLPLECTYGKFYNHNLCTVDE